MQEVQVKEVARREKGRVFFRFDNGTEFTLYRSEIRGLPQAESTLLMTEDAYLPVSLYEKILTEIVGKRAKKRALFLLERMDRTESQLCEKLRQNGYPEECVAAAVEYVKQYHYIDDLRYAKQYIRYHQQKKASTPVVGWSRNRTLGLWTNAQHSASFCFIPQDSAPARLFLNGSSWQYISLILS